MNVKETLRKTEEYLAARLPVDKLNYASMVQKKEVPVHRLSWAYYMGGLALFFFMVQIATGVMLLFYGLPWLLFKANLSANIGQILLMLTATVLGLWGLHHLLHGFATATRLSENDESDETDQ